jgi:hypothetical protein
MDIKSCLKKIHLIFFVMASAQSATKNKSKIFGGFTVQLDNSKQKAYHHQKHDHIDDLRTIYQVHLDFRLILLFP